MIKEHLFLDRIKSFFSLQFDQHIFILNYLDLYLILHIFYFL